MDNFEELRLAILDRTALSAWGTDTRKACELQSGEMLKASSITDTQAVLIFETKYGNKPGLRTVILTAPDAESDLRVVTNMFSAHDKTPVVTPTIAKFRAADITVAIELPKWYRLVDAQGNIIADDMPERWARCAAAAMSEFGVRLVEMIGSRAHVEPKRLPEDDEPVKQGYVLDHAAIDRAIESGDTLEMVAALPGYAETVFENLRADA